MLLIILIGKNSYFTEDAHVIRSRSFVQTSSQVERNAGSLEMKVKKCLEVTCQRPEKYTTRLSGNALKTLDPFGQGKRKRDAVLAKTNLTPLLFATRSQLIASKRWCPMTVRRLHTKDCQQQGKLQEYFSKMLGISSSSSRVIWEASERERHEGENNSVSDVAGSCNERTVFQERRTRFKSILGFEECHKMQYTRRWTDDQNPNIVDKLQAGYHTKSIIVDLGKRGISNTLHQRNGEQWIVRRGRDFLNSSMPNVLEKFKRRNSLLHLWCMPYAFARKDQKSNKSIRNQIKFILFNTRRGFQRTKTRTATKAVWQLESKRCKKRILECRMDRKYSRYLDYLLTKWFGVHATWTERSRNHNTLFL